VVSTPAARIIFLFITVLYIVLL
jgi:hypothetical protein